MMDVILASQGRRSHTVVLPSPWKIFDDAVGRFTDMSAKLELAFADAEQKKQAALASHVLAGGRKPTNSTAEKEREAEEAETLVGAIRLAVEQTYDAIVAVVEDNREQWAAAAAAAEEGKRLEELLAARERRLDLELAGRFARGFPERKTVRGGHEIVVDGIGKLQWQQIEDTLKREVGLLPPPPRTLGEHVKSMAEAAA